MVPSSSPPTPSPGPSWAEVLRGGVERRGGQSDDPRRDTGSSCGQAPPPHNPAVSPLPSPSSLDQFKAWLRCKEQGYSARLVLETSCGEEEISFWCCLTTAKTAAAGTQAPKRMKSAWKKERDKKRRQAWRERRKSRTAAATAVVAVAVPSPATASAAPAPMLPTVEPPEKRPKRSAAICASRRLNEGARRQDLRSPLPPPEQNRGAVGGMDADHDCNASVDDTQARVEALDSPTPLSPPPWDLPDINPTLVAEEAFTLDATKEDENDGDKSHRSSEEEETSEESFDNDFDEEEWEDGRRLNTCDPPWPSVFPVNNKRCRFCRRLPPEPDGDGECVECDKYTTFQLVKKYAPRLRYPKEY